MDEDNISQLPVPEPNVWLWDPKMPVAYPVVPMSNRWFREYAEKHPDEILFYAELTPLDV